MKKQASAPHRDIDEAETVIELALYLFNIPNSQEPRLSIEESMKFCASAIELLCQYLLKLKHGHQPELSPETLDVLARAQGGEFVAQIH